MKESSNHIIKETSSIKEALERLNVLAADAVLFVCNPENQLIGSLTDGDIRRGLLSGINLGDNVKRIIQPDPKFFVQGQVDMATLKEFRKNNFKIVPVLDAEKHIVDIVNFRKQKSYLPIDIVLMAGGKGLRLRPLTEKTPKPMLLLGDRPIIERHILRLYSFGVGRVWISVNYLADVIVSHMIHHPDHSKKVAFIHERQEMGTIGSVRLNQEWENDVILVANSDLLSDVDYEAWYEYFVDSGSDFCVLSVPYDTNIPFAVLEIKENRVIGLKEKPTVVHQVNGGMYMFRKECLELIDQDYFDATDLIDSLIKNNKVVTTYMHTGYWLDIGRHSDYTRALNEYKLLED